MPTDRSPPFDLTGIAGVAGDRPESVRGIASAMHPGDAGRLGGSTARSTHVEGGVGVHASEHPAHASAVPAETTGGDANVWVIGELYGVEGERGYRQRPADVDDATFLARELDRAGVAGLDGAGDVFAGLNGHFVAVVHDREAGEVAVATDRLGSHPVHVARPAPGTVAFATQIQALAGHGAITPAFDEPNLLQYLRYRRVPGTETPLDGVEKLPPSSITTVDLADGSTTSRSYWEPEYRPLDRPFGYFVDRFAETFRTVVREWADPEREYGVLLSGGSDSRLLLAALEEPDVTAYHMGGWRNREARVAERVADAAGCDFQFLKREGTYDERLLERTAAVSNFDGFYYQGYALPFREQLTGEVDALAAGLYADTLFKGAAIPKPRLPVGPLGSMTLPLASRIRDPRTLVKRTFHGGSGGRSGSGTVATGDEDPLLCGLSVDGDRVRFHGVEYPDPETFRLARLYYPLSNGTDLIYTNSLRQIAPYRSPFLDNRLVDLHLRMPATYQLRRDVVARALERLAPDLAAIPHEPDGAPLTTSFPVRYAARHARALGRKVGRKVDAGPTPPAPYMRHVSRRDHGEFVRSSDFFAERLRANAPVAEAVDALDADGGRSALAAHLDGADRTVDLYTLLSTLSMPVTRAVAGVDESDDTGRVPETVDDERLGATATPGTDGADRSGTPARVAAPGSHPLRGTLQVDP